MSDEGIRPLPDDAAGEQIISMFDLDAADWNYTEAGDYQAAIVQCFKRDGSELQTLIALEWPIRNRNTGELSTMRLLISPEDAVGLAEVITTSARWLKIRGIIGN